MFLPPAYKQSPQVSFDSMQVKAILKCSSSKSVLEPVVHLLRVPIEVDLGPVATSSS
jgi:hypothetical protein